MCRCYLSFCNKSYNHPISYFLNNDRNTLEKLNLTQRQKQKKFHLLVIEQQISNNEALQNLYFMGHFSNKWEVWSFSFQNLQ